MSMEADSLEVVHHGFCQRMFRELLQTIENVRQRIACSGASTGRHCLRIPYQLADYRFSFSHRSGLVEYHGVYLAWQSPGFRHLLSECPCSAPLPMPTMMAVGVASPSAHGQAMMTTVTNASNPWVNPSGSGPVAHHMAMKASTAMPIMVGTNIAGDACPPAAAPVPCCLARPAPCG